MGTLFRPFADARLYRRLAFLLSAVALSPLWFGLLLAGWLTVGLLAFTPLVVPSLLAFRKLTSLAAQLECTLARRLLGVEIHPAEPAYGDRGYWGRIRGVLSDRSFWLEQTYLLQRMLVGAALSIGVVSLLAVALGLIATPITYAAGAHQDIGSWQVDTLPRALAFVPAGLVLLLVGPT